MTVQFSTPVRNAMLDAIEATIGAAAKLRVYSGSMPANAAAAATGTMLVEFVLASDWMSNAASGAKSLSGLSLTAVAAAGAPTNAGYWRLYDTSVTSCGAQGTITVTGGGGDMTLGNISIAAGQNVDIATWTFTGGNP